jgi:hypothetical protein
MLPNPPDTSPLSLIEGPWLEVINIIYDDDE